MLIRPHWCWPASCAIASARGADARSTSLPVLRPSFARRTRIHVHQFAMQPIERLLGGGVVFQGIGCVQPLRHRWFLLVGQVIQHIPPLQSRALARRLQERGFRLPAAFTITPVSQSAPSLRLQHPLIEPYVKFSLIRLSGSLPPAAFSSYAQRGPESSTGRPFSSRPVAFSRTLAVCADVSPATNVEVST